MAESEPNRLSLLAEPWRRALLDQGAALSFAPDLAERPLLGKVERWIAACVASLGKAIEARFDDTAKHQAEIEKYCAQIKSALQSTINQNRACLVKGGGQWGEIAKILAAEGMPICPPQYLEGPPDAPPELLRLAKTKVLEQWVDHHVLSGACHGKDFPIVKDYIAYWLAGGEVTV